MFGRGGKRKTAPELERGRVTAGVSGRSRLILLKKGFLYVLQLLCAHW